MRSKLQSLRVNKTGFECEWKGCNNYCQNIIRIHLVLNFTCSLFMHSDALLFNYIARNDNKNNFQKYVLCHLNKIGTCFVYSSRKDLNNLKSNITLLTTEV